MHQYVSLLLPKRDIRADLLAACAPAADPGECLTRIPMWYYDHRKKQCAQFDYLGCKGNDNKFLRKQDCLDTCLTRILNL